MFGANVAVNYAGNEAAAHETADLVAAEGQIAHVVRGDVAAWDDVQEMVRDVEQTLGPIDLLVNNAGVFDYVTHAETTPDVWQRQIDVNLGGVFYCSKAALPHLKATGDGFIVNIGSLAGRNFFAGGTAYNAAKAGVVGMTEAMMLDVRQDDVRVSVVMPGTVNTHFSGNRAAERSWPLEGDDVALAVMQLLAYPKGAHVSRIEMRPSKPPKG